MDKTLEKRIRIIFFVVILIVVVTIGIIYVRNRTNPDIYTYTGPGGEYTFNVLTTDGITTHVIRVFVGDNEFYIPLKYGPKQLEDIPIEGDVVNDIVLNKGKPKETIYITQDPDLVEETDSKSALAVVEINRITGVAAYSLYEIPTDTAVTRSTNRSAELELPVKTCEDVTEEESVILIKRGDTNRIYSDRGCVVLEAVENDDFFKVADALVLKLLGVY
jgi:hypothetical protein